MALRAIVDRLLEHPAVYAAWQAPFVESKFAPVERRLRSLPVRRVLDVGCGPGTNARRFAGADYVGVDINARYLEIARATHAGTFIQADIGAEDLPSLGVFDTILVNSFLHHLDDEAVSRTLHQLPRLLAPDGRAHMLELVMPDRPSMATVMARLDRGRYARPLPAWLAIFGRHFDAVEVEPYHYAGGLWSMVYFQGRARACDSR
jgi:SAM-dependent methyltransferase